MVVKTVFHMLKKLSRDMEDDKNYYRNKNYNIGDEKYTGWE